MTSPRRLAAAVCGALLVSAPAFAADAVLALEGIEGDASAGARTMQAQSYSWGMSRPGAPVAGSGKVNVQDLSLTRAAPRDTTSGMATGRRGVAAVDTTAAAPVAGDATSEVVIREVTVVLPEADAKSACATGKHIKSATLTARGERVELEDVTVTSCTTSAGVSTLAMRGHQKTGHVTLMK